MLSMSSIWSKLLSADKQLFIDDTTIIKAWYPTKSVGECHRSEYSFRCS